jgi:hypothetical protein
MSPTFSYTLNGTVNNPPYVSINPIIGAAPKSGNWYYYLIKNSGINSDSLTNITLDPKYTWYMYLVAHGGNAGKNASTGIGGGGGGGTGQILNIHFHSDATQAQTHNLELVLHPFNNENESSNKFQMTTFVTNINFTVPILNIVKPAGTYYLYPGSCGGPGTSNQYGTGGSGGSVYNTNNIYRDPGIIGSAGGGGFPQGATYYGYTSNNPSKHTINYSGSTIFVTFSDGLKGSVSGGNVYYSGIISQVMFYCVG